MNYNAFFNIDNTLKYFRITGLLFNVFFSMQLRERQKRFVDSVIARLDDKRVTLGVAPTGFGKTVVLAHIIKHYNLKTCVVAHRKEINEQNMQKASIINPDKKITCVNAENKDFSGDIVFCMIQTLSRENALKTIESFDLLIVDEAHHAAMPSYEKVLRKCHSINPNILLLGLTATPLREDKKDLLHIFLNVADQVTLTELITAGWLVNPITKVLDVGVTDQLSSIRTGGSEYKVDIVDSIVNKSVPVKRMVDAWCKYGENRQTVFFCSTISHAQNICTDLLANNIEARVITSEVSEAERESILADYESGRVKVLCNVSVLTEGWDSPSTSCVVLARPTSFKSTMIQMVGRGLRTCEGKKDCLILDFGVTIAKHGSIEQDISEYKSKENGTAPEKVCPDCEAPCYVFVKKCACCGYVFFTEKKKEVLEEIKLKEINILEKSKYLWLELDFDMYNFHCAKVADFLVIGQRKKNGDVLAIRMKGFNLDEKEAIKKYISFENFIKESNKFLYAKWLESDFGAKFNKSQKWLYEKASAKQMAAFYRFLGSTKAPFDLNNITKYEASIRFVILKKLDFLIEIINGEVQCLIS